ncbi:MAG: phosphate/phosphite/phosphonate ABC transporter substrate-binding protein, partial [Anaerolineales bacterium]
MSNSAEWQIGFDARLEPKDDVRQVASLAEWLEKKSGLSFGVYIPNANESVVDSICSGKAAFAVVGTVSYLQAHDQCNAHILVRGLNAEGNDTYRAAIIVPVDSPLNTLADLKRHTFAFGAINSTQGNLIPRIMLQRAGLSLEDFRKYIYTGSHAATANAVTSHHVDAGALQDTLALALAKRGLVRILAFSEPYPSSGVIVAPSVPTTISSLVQKELLLLDPTGKDASVLYEWWRTEMPLGFVRASDDDYEDLRKIAIV